MPAKDVAATPRDAAPAPPALTQGEALLMRYGAALGRAEDVRALLDHLARIGVRNIERYTARWTEEDFHHHLDTALGIRYAPTIRGASRGPAIKRKEKSPAALQRDEGQTTTR